MTIDDIRKSDKLWLTPADIAPVIGCDPQLIRVQAHTAPERLGFPVVVIGTRTKIPRKPFIEFFGG